MIFDKKWISPFFAAPISKIAASLFKSSIKAHKGNPISLLKFLNVEKLFLIPALRMFLVVVLPLLPVIPMTGPVKFFKVT